MPEKKSTSRRNFLKILQSVIAASGMAAIIGPIIAYFWPASLEEVPSDPVSAGPVDSIAQGSAKMVRFGRYPALIVNTPEGIRVYSAVCTHFACIVQWVPERDRIECPCHEGYFRPEDGSVIYGPPPRALDPIPHFVQNGILYIGGEA